MDHKGTVRLETERLVLRRIRVRDAEAAFRNWTGDDKVTEFLTWETHRDAEVTARIFEEWVGRYGDNGFYQWAIVLKGDGDEPIGTISVVSRKDEIDLLHIGYCIGSKWWHRGIMSEAFAAVIKFLFEQVGANRIESRHDPRNPNSGKVMVKCGLKYEGTLRQADRNNRGIADAVTYAILAEDYFVSKK